MEISDKVLDKIVNALLEAEICPNNCSLKLVDKIDETKCKSSEGREDCEICIKEAIIEASQEDKKP